KSRASSGPWPKSRAKACKLRKTLRYSSVRRPRREGGRHDGCTIDRKFDRIVWARIDPGEAVLGHRGEQDDLLQHAVQGLRLAAQAAVHLREGRGRRPPRGH